MRMQAMFTIPCPRNRLCGTETILAYTPGATTPYLTFDRNTAGTTAMAIDAANNLYVANDGKGYFGVGSFKVYELGSNKLLRKVSREVNNPIALAIGP
jgi:hypothetical protein